MNDERKRTAQAGTTVAGSTGIAVLVVWIAGMLGVAMSAEVGVVLGGLVAGAASAIFVYGVRGVLGILWRGSR